MVVKVDTQIVQEASTVTFGILKEVITNTNLSIIIENDDDGDTETCFFLYSYNKPRRCTIFSLDCVNTLHVSGPFVAHRQEDECIVWLMVLVLLLSQLSVGWQLT
jgi:hypothetical protein